MKSIVAAAIGVSILIPTTAQAGAGNLTEEYEAACLSKTLNTAEAVYHCASRTPVEFAITDAEDFWIRAGSGRLAPDELLRLGRWYGVGHRLTKYCKAVGGLVTVFYTDLQSSQLKGMMKNKAFKADFKRGQKMAEYAIASHKDFVAMGRDVNEHVVDSWFCTHAFTDYGLVTVTTAEVAE